MKNVGQPSPKDLESKSVYLPSSIYKKTLIFDLDETLVHCIDDVEGLPYDKKISVAFATGEVVEAGVNIRPYAYECLKRANKHYQVVIFTASHKSYADAVLDMLEEEFRSMDYLTDEERQIISSASTEEDGREIVRQIKQQQQLIQYRLYRDHCIRTPEGIYIKDLRIIKNRDLKDLLIVDNAVYSFGYQLDNGIPIIPYYEDKENDEELMHLIYYFSCIYNSADVRVQNRKAFMLFDIQQCDINSHLKIMQEQMNNADLSADNNEAQDEQPPPKGPFSSDSE